MRDEEFVERVRSGDSIAALALLERYLPLLRSRVRRRLDRKVRRRVAESDVIQETFIAVMSRLDDFEDRGEGSFGAWLSSVLDHKIIDQLRRHVSAEKRSVNHEETKSDAQTASAVASDWRTASQTLATNEAVRAVHDKLTALPEDYRSVLKLVHFEGMKLDDAALVLNRSREAVRRLYGRALSSLRERLET
jgi:RNA polymerase sigma-70 factor (subfamily 1)